MLKLTAALTNHIFDLNKPNNYLINLCIDDF
jgi:hypothetical protein